MPAVCRGPIICACATYAGSIRCDPPSRLTFYVSDREYLAAGAVNLLREREERYPSLVTAGKLTAEAASLGLARARAVVDQWRWITDRSSPPLPEWNERQDRFGIFNFELAADMTAAAAKARALADRAPKHWAAGELADIYAALAWLQQDHFGVARIVHDVDVERLASAAASLARRAA